MEEESNIFFGQNNQDSTNECICGDIVRKLSSEKIETSDRKALILSTVARTESYLRERRIPELIRFLLTMIISHSPDKPVVFLEKLLDDCMLFRAGHGIPPVLFKNKHLEAVIKSFDPGQRGWLSAGQVQRIYATLGFTTEEIFEERIPCNLVLSNLKKTQEIELLHLLEAGLIKDNKSDDLKSVSLDN
ncbi:unnamed protein product, partial [Brenthis ino]